MEFLSVEHLAVLAATLVLGVAGAVVPRRRPDGPWPGGARSRGRARGQRDHDPGGRAGLERLELGDRPPALDEKGADRADWGTGVETGLAGALLLELAAAGCLAEEGGRLVPAGCDPPADPLLRDALDVVRDSDRPRKAASWIRRPPRALRPLRLRAAERLVARGVLAEERRRVLGLRRTRLPEVDPRPEAALRERLREVLTGAAEPAPREAVLIALMEPYDLVGKVVERGDLGRRRWQR